VIYQLEGVTKTYPTAAGPVRSLSAVSFEVERGERVALLGASGAGKTSLFRLLNATLRPSAGRLRFDGRDMSDMSGAELRATRRRIGTISQKPHLVQSMTAFEHALSGRLGYWSTLETLWSFALPSRKDRARATEALDAVGLADKRDARADELSGGQQQRLSIARVLTQEPDVILADEPFASLDPTLTESIAQLLFDLADLSRRTLVTTLHDVELALRFHRIIGLKEGRVVFDLPASRVHRGILDALYASEAAGRPSPAKELTS
jgi:phosphonate transport system ATP-binding protein